MNDERGMKSTCLSVHHSSFSVHRFFHLSAVKNTVPNTLLIFSLTLSLAATSCKSSEVTGNQNSNAANANSATEETLASPPFITKEPERHQAVRVITSS